MICTNCGHELNEGLKFCTKCGARQYQYRVVKKNGPMFYVAEVFRKYVVFKGRARRAEYWWFVLFIIIFLVVLRILNEIVIGYMVRIGITIDIIVMTSNIIGVITNILFLGTLLPGISVGVRRMHDCNKSGWFLLIPIYNLILCCNIGTYGSNRYGSNPKYEE